MNDKVTNIAILGATGSIGRNTLEVVQASAGRLQVVALAANSSASLLLEQAGQPDAARQRWAEITLNARHAPKFARRVNRKWIEMARSRA